MTTTSIERLDMVIFQLLLNLLKREIKENIIIEVKTVNIGDILCH